MSARSAIPLLAGTSLVLAAILIALALGASARSAEGAPPSFPPDPVDGAARASTESPPPKVANRPPTESPPPKVANRPPTESPSPKVANRPPTESPLPEAASRPRQRPSYGVARVARTLDLRSRPGAAVDGSLGPSTELGSPRVVGVAARRGDWLGVVTTARPNGRLAWVKRGDPALRVKTVAWSLHADLSERRVELRRSGRLVKRLKVAIGAPGSPTPTGRFAVTDKLEGSAYGPYYGCCILALSGYQPKLPAGWQGGNRIAIHGTDSPATIGAAASAGCLRAADADLRVLMRRVPLGTPVFIRA